MGVSSKIIKLPIYVRGMAGICRLLRLSRQQLHAKLLVLKRKHQGKAVTKEAGNSPMRPERAGLRNPEIFLRPLSQTAAYKILQII